MKKEETIENPKLAYTQCCGQFLESNLKVFLGEEDSQKVEELINKILPLYSGYTRSQIEKAYFKSVSRLDAEYIINLES